MPWWEQDTNISGSWSIKNVSQTEFKHNSYKRAVLIKIRRRILAVFLKIKPCSENLLLKVAAKTARCKIYN